MGVGVGVDVGVSVGVGVKVVKITGDIKKNIVTSERIDVGTKLLTVRKNKIYKYRYGVGNYYYPHHFSESRCVKKHRVEKHTDDESKPYVVWDNEYLAERYKVVERRVDGCVIFIKSVTAEAFFGKPK